MTAGHRLQGTPAPERHVRGHGGVRLAADVRGPATGRAVLLLHGGGQTRHAWAATARDLAARGYRAVTLDARGHGDSDWAPDGDYSQQAMVEDLVSVVASLAVPRPVLVGASMGGATGLVAAGRGGVEASALVLVDVTPAIEPAGATRIRGFMNARPEGYESLEEVARHIERYQSHRRRERRLQGLAKNVRLGDDGRYRWHWDPRFGRRPVDLEARERELEENAARLTVPTLLVRGGRSELVSEHGVEQFRRACPHAEYVNVAGARHMVAGDRNDVFAEALLDFLQRVAPPV